MATLYFSKGDYREAMRQPYSADRAHAICRKLTGCASQSTRWYGAHYWAACALLGRYLDKPTAERKAIEKAEIEKYRRTFLREVDGCENTESNLPRVWDRLFTLAVRRVRSVRRQAVKLPNSLAW